MLIDGLVQDCSNSIANALELLQSALRCQYMHVSVNRAIFGVDNDLLPIQHQALTECISISYSDSAFIYLFFIFETYSAVPLKRGQFSHRYSQKTPYSLPVRARYGVSFLDSTSDWYSASVPAIIYAIFYYFGMHYNGTWLYLRPTKIHTGYNTGPNIYVMQGYPFKRLESNLYM